MQPTKVWIVNSSGHNFDAAKEFGEEMIPLTAGKVNIFNVERLIHEFKGKMVNHQKDDWILLSGNTVLNVLAVTVALAKHREVKLLLYDVIRKEYVPREISYKEFK
ncbi:MAG: hypothetical protein QMD71_06465 [bacterium]|nr:hypothetical protein [bacterium]